MKKVKLFLCFLLFLTIGCNQFFGEKKTKQKVSSITGVLTLHPDSVAIKGSDNKIYHFFLDTKNQCIFITDNTDIYQTFSSFLPKIQLVGREIEVEGTSISPFTLFSKSQLKEQGKKIGLELNSYSLYKIFNYGLRTSGIIKYSPSGN